MKILKLIVCLMSILTMSVSMANAALTGYWTFDEGSGSIAHDSAGTNNGTIYGATWTTGPSGGAIDFDPANNAYVSVADSPDLRYSQSDSFTIAFWALSSPGGGGEVISKMRGSGQSGVFGYEVRCNGGEYVDFRVERSGYAATDVTSGTNSLAVGNWYHVAAVYDNKSMKVYLNGALEGSGTFAYNTGSTSPDGPLIIGTRGYDGTIDPAYNVKGRIDDLRFYNEALNANSISQLYQTTPEPATLCLLGLGAVLLRRRK